jgi:hypothetical protein
LNKHTCYCTFCNNIETYEEHWCQRSLPFAMKTQPRQIGVDLQTPVTLRSYSEIANFSVSATCSMFAVKRRRLFT